MQLHVRVKLDGPCVLPIGYHHILQSAIYSQIGGELHDKGFQYNKRGYKLFTFGPIEGRYIIDNKSIIFNDEISFEVRCLIDEVGLNFIKNITKNGIRLGKNSYKGVEVTIQNHVIEEDCITITMKSPICVYATSEDKRTIYYNPECEEFYSAVKDNFERKYAAVEGCFPTSNIEFNLVKYNERDRYFTKYKGFYIEAWKGVYELSGDPKYLNFLYDTGLGAKNSQGFGMFTVIEEATK